MSNGLIITGGLDESTRQQIETFFANLKQTVLDQAAHGAVVKLDIQSKFSDLTDPIHYGPVIVDRRFVGCKWTIDIPDFASVPPQSDTPELVGG